MLIRILREHRDRSPTKGDRNAGFTNRTLDRPGRDLPLSECTRQKRLINERPFHGSNDASNPVICEKGLARCGSNLSEHNHRVLISSTSIATEQHEVGETQISE
jgi:hypothetical protein